MSLGLVEAGLRVGKLSEIPSMALVSDIISYGASKVSHGREYQYVRGDGGIGSYRDAETPALWETFGMAPELYSDVLFLALDHPNTYKEHLK